MKKTDPFADIRRVFGLGGHPKLPLLKRRLRKLVREAVLSALEGDPEYSAENKLAVAKIIAEELVP